MIEQQFLQYLQKLAEINGAFFDPQDIEGSRKSVDWHSRGEVICEPMLKHEAVTAEHLADLLIEQELAFALPEAAMPAYAWLSAEESKSRRCKGGFRAEESFVATELWRTVMSLQLVEAKAGAWLVTADNVWQYEGEGNFTSLEELINSCTAPALELYEEVRATVQKRHEANEAQVQEWLALLDLED